MLDDSDELVGQVNLRLKHHAQVEHSGDDDEVVDDMVADDGHGGAREVRGEDVAIQEGGGDVLAEDGGQRCRHTLLQRVDLRGLALHGDACALADLEPVASTVELIRGQGQEVEMVVLVEASPVQVEAGHKQASGSLLQSRILSLGALLHALARRREAAVPSHLLGLVRAVSHLQHPVAIVVLLEARDHSGVIQVEAKRLPPVQPRCRGVAKRRRCRRRRIRSRRC
jgi:hypothetical protein